jgi:hypothetical protein
MIETILTVGLAKDKYSNWFTGQVFGFLRQLCCLSALSVHYCTVPYIAALFRILAAVGLYFDSDCLYIAQ